MGSADERGVRSCEPTPIAAWIVAGLAERGLTLACAESLTGGALSSAIVDVPGASRVYRGGATCYATPTKNSVLGVSAQRLAITGPVDGVVATEMAAGAARLFAADVALSTTGVAGPGSADGHPAGTVWIGISGALGEDAVCHSLAGDRGEVRAGAVERALELLAQRLGIP